MNLARAAQRILNLMLPGRVTLIDDTDVVQRVQVDHGPIGPGGSMRVFDKLPLVGLYGFTSNAPIGSDVLAVFFEGDPTKGVVAGTNHQASRLKGLETGDAAMYDVRGAYAWFKPAGLVIDAAGLDVTIQNSATTTIIATAKVRVQAPHIECTGDIIANCDGTPISLQQVHDDYNAHKHPPSAATTDHPLP